MRRIRLGVVGAGLIWDRSHKHKLRELDRLFEITAFAVRSDGTHEKLSRGYPAAKIFRDVHNLLALDDVDAVVVLTPLHINATITMAALEAEKHVLAEKPLATCLDDVHRILNLEKQKQRKVLVLEQYRYDDRMKILKEILDEGRIGNVVSYEIAEHDRIDQGRYNAGGYGNTDWRINPRFPLGALFDRGIHAITRLTRLFGKAESVYALGTGLRADFGNYDHVLMMFAHAAGIHGTFSFAGYLDGASNYFYIRGTGGTIRVGQTKMEITGDNEGAVNFPTSDSSLAMWQHCAECLSGTESPVYGAKESLEDIAMLVAVDESIREGRKVLLY